MLRPGASLVVVTVLFAGGCSVIADPGVTYKPCLGTDGTRYFDSFDGESDELAGCLWASDVAPTSTLEVEDGDLILRPTPGRVWSDETHGELAFRRMPGDFVVVTLVEPSASITDDRCAFGPADGAGLALRRAPLGTDKGAWTTLLVSPFFGAPKPSPCADDDANKPLARIVSAAFGFEPSAPAASVEGVGEDGEAFIALCRQGDSLASFYGLKGAAEKPTWRRLRTQQVVRGPMDVGVTAVSEMAGAGLEGHFQFAVFDDISTGLVADGCTGALERFVPPNDEGGGAQ